MVPERVFGFCALDPAAVDVLLPTGNDNRLPNGRDDRMTSRRCTATSTLEAARTATSKCSTQREPEVNTKLDDPAILTYDVEAIPDPNEHQLAALCHGDVRRTVSNGFEHLLRVIARFQEAEIALALRFLFDPKGNGSRHGRLRLQVAMRVGGGVRREVARQLIEVGPICEFFKFHAAPACSRNCVRSERGWSSPTSCPPR